jgi:hypothetical protein
MPEPFVIQSFHKNLARLVSLAICVNSAPASRAASIGEVADKYASTLTKGVEIESNKKTGFVEYISRRALTRKYGVTNSAELLEKIESGRVTAEFQDVCLSDPEVPSGVGNEQPTSVEKTVKVCRDLGFVSKQDNTIQSLGRVIQILLDRKTISNGGTCGNPFTPDIPLAAACYFGVYRSDMAFQTHLLSSLSDEDRSFSGYFAGRVGNALSDLSTTIPRNPATRVTHDWLLKQIRYAGRFGGQKNAKLDGPRISSQSIIRPIENILIPRLEFLVDISVVHKTDRNALTYRANPAVNKFIENCPIGPGFLFEHFFHFIASSSEIFVIDVTDENTVSHLNDAYELLKNRAGYAPIAETVILANGMAFDPVNWNIMEIDSALKRLNHLARSGGGVRIASDRFRQPEAFRLS